MRSTTAGGRDAPHGALCGGAGQMGSNDLPPYAPSTPEGKPAAQPQLSGSPPLAPTGPPLAPPAHSPRLTPPAHPAVRAGRTGTGVRPAPPVLRRRPRRRSRSPFQPGGGLVRRRARAPAAPSAPAFIQPVDAAIVSAVTAALRTGRQAAPGWHLRRGGAGAHDRTALPRSTPSVVSRRAQLPGPRRRHARNAARPRGHALPPEPARQLRPQEHRPQPRQQRRHTLAAARKPRPVSARRRVS
ncbi:hypothetical protein SMICM304S_06635 [Streptomyces microflavus]